MQWLVLPCCAVLDLRLPCNAGQQPHAGVLTATARMHAGLSLRLLLPVDSQCMHACRAVAAAAAAGASSFHCSCSPKSTLFTVGFRLYMSRLLAMFGSSSPSRTAVVR